MSTLSDPKDRKGVPYSRPIVLFTCGWMIAKAVTHTAFAFWEGILGTVLCQCNFTAISLWPAAYMGDFSHRMASCHSIWCLVTVLEGRPSTVYQIFPWRCPCENYHGDLAVEQEHAPHSAPSCSFPCPPLLFWESESPSLPLSSHLCLQDAHKVRKVHLWTWKISCSLSMAVSRFSAASSHPLGMKMSWLVRKDCASRSR